MGLVLSFNANMGVLLAFIIGAYGNFYTTPIFAIALLVAFTILFTFFPETPAFLVRQNLLVKNRWVC